MPPPITTTSKWSAASAETADERSSTAGSLARRPAGQTLVQASSLLSKELWAARREQSGMRHRDVLVAASVVCAFSTGSAAASLLPPLPTGPVGGIVTVVTGTVTGTTGTVGSVVGGAVDGVLNAAPGSGGSSLPTDTVGDLITTLLGGSATAPAGSTGSGGDGSGAAG